MTASPVTTNRWGTPTPSPETRTAFSFPSPPGSAAPQAVEQPPRPRQYMELPVGWLRYYDETQGRCYFHNVAKGLTTWGRPPPPQSQEVLDAISAVARATEEFNVAMGEGGKGSATHLTVPQALALHDAAKNKWEALGASLLAWRDADLREASRRAELIP